MVSPPFLQASQKDRCATYFGFDNVPFLVDSIGEDPPHLLVDFEVRPRELLDSVTVDAFDSFPLHQSLVPLPAGVAGFLGKVSFRERTPAEPFGSCAQEDLVTLRGPGSAGDVRAVALHVSVDGSGGPDGSWIRAVARFGGSTTLVFGHAGASNVPLIWIRAV